MEGAPDQSSLWGTNVKLYWHFKIMGAIVGSNILTAEAIQIEHIN